METEKLEFWALVDLFGHLQIAGKCTEQNIAGNNMLRIDVPETKRRPAYTTFRGHASIYALTPIGELEARRIAEHLNTAPIEMFLVEHLFEKQIKLKLEEAKNDGKAELEKAIDQEENEITAGWQDDRA